MKYEVPSMEVVEFEGKDFVCASNPQPGDNDHDFPIIP